MSAAAAQPTPAPTGKLPALNPDRTARMKEFRTAHPRRYTMDFNKSVTQLIADPTIDTHHRLLALLKRRSWGNYSDYAVDDHTLEPTAQTEISRELGVDRRRVHDAIQFWEERGHVERRNGAIFVYEDPAGQRAKKGALMNQPPLEEFPESDYKAHLAVWNAAHPEKAQRLQALRTEVSDIQREILQDFRETRKRQREADKLSGMDGQLDANLSAHTGQSLSAHTGQTGGSVSADSGQMVPEMADNLSSTPVPKPASILIYEKEEKEEFLGGESAASVLSSQTTTTLPPPSKKELNSLRPTPSDIEVITAALRTIMPEASPSAAQQIFIDSRKAEPQATAQDMANMIRKKVPGYRGVGKFTGFCIKTVPAEFAAVGGLAYAREPITPEDPPSSAPYGTLGPRAEYEELGAQIEALPLGHSNRLIHERRREELRSELKALAEKEKARRR